MLDNQSLRHTACIRLVLVGSGLSLGAGVPDDREREVVTQTVDADGAPAPERSGSRGRVTPSPSARPSTRRGAPTSRARAASAWSPRGRCATTAPRIEAPDALERVHARFRETRGADDGWADRVRVFFGGKITFALTPIPEPATPTGP